MKYVKMLIVLAVLGAYPAVAIAHKAPTKHQRMALVRTTDSYLHEPIPGKCLSEEISTPNMSWAEVHFAPGPNGHLPVICAKFAANGVILFHFRAGQWRFEAAGSSFRNANGGCALSKTIPRKVITDFKLC
ncbi:MAG TPA: hypothetical protein VHV28_05355 [Solirubrobacteraceae bacterium]|jgi:hypothetical protein|nr:hypothetical protein [Solirubrobacteraceae bacterium]